MPKPIEQILIELQGIEADIPQFIKTGIPENVKSDNIRSLELRNNQSIQDILEHIEDFAETGTVLVGVQDPNVTPPPNYSIGSLYLQKTMPGSVNTALFIYTGIDGVGWQNLISNQNQGPSFFYGVNPDPNNILFQNIKIGDYYVQTSDGTADGDVLSFWIFTSLLTGDVFKNLSTNYDDRAKTDASNLSQQNVEDWKEALNLSGIYQYKGSVLFANLPIENQQIGDVYDVLDEFVLNGNTYPAGTNVAWTAGGWDALGGKYQASWGTISGKIETQTDLIYKFNQKEDKNKLIGKSVIGTPADNDILYFDSTAQQFKFKQNLGDVAGVVEITQNGKTGLVSKYQSENLESYLDVGEGSVNLSSVNLMGFSGTAGDYSVCAGGDAQHPTGDYSFIGGGITNHSPGAGSVVGGGEGNVSDGMLSSILGGQSVIAFGDYSVCLGGTEIYARSYGEVVAGLYGTDYTPVSRTQWNSNDRMFNLGNGRREEDPQTNILTKIRSDAFTIYKNGLATLPSVTNELIEEESTGKAVVTKEYLVETAGRRLVIELEDDVVLLADSNIYTYDLANIVTGFETPIDWTLNFKRVGVQLEKLGDVFNVRNLSLIASSGKYTLRCSNNTSAGITIPAGSKLILYF